MCKISANFQAVDIFPFVKMIPKNISLYVNHLIGGAILNICFAFSVFASSEIYKWEFEIPSPGKYKLEVTHTFINPASKAKRATYIIQTQERRYQRTLFLNAIQSDNPFIPLSPDIFSTQNVVVEIVGAPQDILDNTKVSMTLVEPRTYQTSKQIRQIEQAQFNELLVLKSIFALPENQINLGRAKLIIDSLINPRLDTAQGEMQLANMAKAIEAMLPPNPTNYDKLNTLKQYLYNSGPWNDFNPYHYDFSDPLGTKLSNKLLMNYMHSRKGNCISMPFLFIALGEKLGLPLTASTAPLHVFVKFKDDKAGQSISLETTSGANPTRNIWYQQQLQITDRAISNGAYLATLTKKETVAVMTVILSEYYFDAGEYEKSIAIAALSVEHYPKFIYGMIKLGNAYHALTVEHFLKKYPTLTQVPIEQRPYYQFLSRNNIGWFQRAEALGWVQPAQEFDRRYTDMVSQKAKASR